MIFLFFGSSLGPLEPELAPFKDLEEIGDIWEISFKVVQCSAVQLGHQAGADATLREMSQRETTEKNNSRDGLFRPQYSFLLAGGARDKRSYQSRPQ